MKTIVPIKSASPATHIGMRFSYNFEMKLVAMTPPLMTLNERIEHCAKLGLDNIGQLLETVENLVRPKLQHLIDSTNSDMCLPSGNLLPQWVVTIDDELLYETDLIISLHGEELRDSGLVKISRGSILMLLCEAAFTGLSTKLS